MTLESEWDRVAGTLPHGAQRKLDVALAIASAPKLLLLDEPMAGMGPVESAEMVALIQRLRQDMAILLIEHDMDAVFQLADRISVLVYGKVLTSGTAAEIQADAQVQAVYLGTEEEMSA
ncbi:Lipopolysaccharide export system ATP-binding protein LptB [compost metagenome]